MSRQEFLVAPFLQNLPLIQDDNLVRIDNCIKPVGDDKAGTPLE